MKNLFKKKFQNESSRYKVTSFLTSSGHMTDDFDKCSVVMASTSEGVLVSLKPVIGSARPFPKNMFVSGIKIGDTFVEKVIRS